MKVKDLSEFMDLRRMKIRIPERLHKQVNAAGLYEYEVYLYSSWGLGIWVKIDKEDTQIYPITNISPQEILEWEVVSTLRAT